MRDWRAMVPAALVVLAVGFHLHAVFGTAWQTVLHQPGNGRDFASYYFAAHVAAEGGDPYARGALGRLARQRGERIGVHPFLYPPPFLLLMAWSLPFDLLSAYRIWFWLDEWFAAAAALALWRWWRPLGPAVAPLVAITVALYTAVPANHVMGQANFPGFALAILGLWLASDGRERAGGVLVGAACMVKMSPALFVAWWLVKGKLRAVAWACGAAVALSVLTLPLAGPAVQVGFYTDVLPTFGSGEYNGLGIPIGASTTRRALFGNHSIPNLYHQLWPGTDLVLSPTARWASLVTTVALVAGLGWLFRDRDGDLLQRACQVSAIAITMLLVPVYTYEHHCIWAIPAVVASCLAILEGRISSAWWVLLAMAVPVWAWEISDWRRLSESLAPQQPVLAWLVQEGKFAALLVFLGATVRGGTAPRP